MPQIPGNTLPGFEFEVQAPNRTIALSGRYAVHGSVGPTSIPASGSASLDVELVISPDMTFNDGIYLVRASVLYGPVDTSAELQIASARLFLTNGVQQFDLGIPSATTLTPGASIVAINETALGIKMADVQRFGWLSPNPLNIHGNLFLKNLDATNPHSATLNLYAIAYVLRGFYS